LPGRWPASWSVRPYDISFVYRKVTLPELSAVSQTSIKLAKVLEVREVFAIVVATLQRHGLEVLAFGPLTMRSGRRVIERDRLDDRADL